VGPFIFGAQYGEQGGGSIEAVDVQRCVKISGGSYRRPDPMTR